VSTDFIDSRRWRRTVRNISPKIIIAAIAAIIIYIALSYVYNTVFRADIEVLALPVSKGDSIVLKLKDNINILIDCGSSDISNVGENVVIPQLAINGVSKLYGIIVTHDDADHTNGLKTVIDVYKPTYIFIADENIENKTLSFIRRNDKYKNIKIQYIRAGDVLKVDEDTVLTFLYPLRNNISGLSTNDQSIVVRLDYKNSSALFTGDLEFKGEKLLMSSRYRSMIDVDLLKVGHHGSKGSTSDNFLEVVSPEIGIISCPKNDRNGYHPHEELLARLAKKQMTILKTGDLGVVKVKSNGNKWTY